MPRRALGSRFLVLRLEFLLSEALHLGHDCVVTVGGLQSNHCRATAVAARLLNLDAHLVLLVREELRATDPGLEGNLLAMRLSGARLHLRGARSYRRLGGDLKAAETLSRGPDESLHVHVCMCLKENKTH